MEKQILRLLKPLWEVEMLNSKQIQKGVLTFDLEGGNTVETSLNFVAEPGTTIDATRQEDDSVGPINPEASTDEVTYTPEDFVTARG